MLHVWPDLDMVCDNESVANSRVWAQSGYSLHTVNHRTVQDSVDIDIWAGQSHHGYRLMCRTFQGQSCGSLSAQNSRIAVKKWPSSVHSVVPRDDCAEWDVAWTWFHQTLDKGVLVQRS